MIFEYVLSGLGMTRINTVNFFTLPPCNAAVCNSLTDINTKGEYYISGLFNAFTEPNPGKVMRANYHKKFKNIHVDSGGLQVITLGKDITPELKKEIYRVQATYGDVAMCFDEIPLVVDYSASSVSSNRTSIDNKTFIVSELEKNARATGRNVNEQLKTFHDLNSDAEVMLIAQGNNRFDFARWVEFAYDEVDDDLKDRIHGIALADTCIGNGMLETVEMCASLPLMNVPDSLKKNIHFLGVGSISRFVPVIELSRGDLFKGINVSFDSTSHTNTMAMGIYTNKKGRKSRIGKTVNNQNLEFFREVYDEIAKYHTHGIDFNTFMEENLAILGNSSAIKTMEDLELRAVMNMTHWFGVLTSTKNFMENVVACQKSADHYAECLGTKYRKMIRPLMLLSKVNTVDEFENWFKLYSKYVESARIKRVDNPSVAGYNSMVTLDSFFA